MNRTISLAAVGFLYAAITSAVRADGLSLDPGAGAPRASTPVWDIATAATPARGPSISSMNVLLLDVSPSTPAADKLTLSFELPIWISGIDGTTGVRGFTAPVHASFLDILESTNSLVGLGGRVEADYGPWIFYVDGEYIKLAKDDIPVRRTSVNVISELAIADAGILYQVGNWNLGHNGDAGPSLTLAGGVAARYMHVGLQLNTRRGLSRQSTEDWADPLFATQMKLNFDKHWEIIARGDVGGGGGADLTWSAVVLLSYRLAITDTMSAAFKIGYQAIGEDYHSGHGNQEFTWDAIMHGPVIDMELRF